MIPNHDAIMLPLLHHLADRKAYTQQQLIKILARHFNLNDTDRVKRVSGKQEALFNHRTGWARTYLTRARLIQSAGRRRCRITPRGLDILHRKPEAINTHFLKQFPDFQDSLRKPGEKKRSRFPAFSKSRADIQKTSFPRKRESQPRSVNSAAREDLSIQKQSDITDTLYSSWNLKGKDSRLRGNDLCVARDTSNQIPEEALESLYQTLRQNLAADLLAKIKTVSPAFFEQVVVDVLVAMGYGGSQKNAAQILGRSGDGGVDGIIKEDKLGLDVIYIQAKRWENPVGRPEVQAFAGSLEGFRAKKGVFMTTSRFTKEAREYVDKIASRIILIEGQQLAELMIDCNVGTSEDQHYIIKKLNSDYFEAV